MRRLISLIIAASLVGSLALTIGPLAPASSSPVAGDDTTYTTFGRVFPDPHGCNTGGSPFAKGNVCAVDFLQIAEIQSGFAYLEGLFPDYLEFLTLSEDFNCEGEFSNEGCEAFQSAGLPNTASADGPITRAKQPLHMVRVTDETVPDKGKEYFVFPLSIHGIERAGVEGGTRAAEDLATWAACEAGTAPEIVNCEAEGEMPHPIMEATPEGSVTAGDALKRSVVYFIYPNPDGWSRGDRATGSQFYQRYNGNGVDLNRDWPTQGYTFRPYTPWSEPETAAFGKVLQAIGPTDKKGNPQWSGGIDLHGQLVDRAFSFTLIGGAERPYNKNQRVLQTVKGAWRDAEARLAWSPLIKPNDAPADDPRVYGVQWGTIWDTIAYTVTGALGDWIDSPIGLNADGIDNEMSLSHLSNCGIGTCFEPDVEQLHVDGNKSLVYSMINYTLKPERTKIRTKGKVGYIFNRGAVKAKDDPTSIPPDFAKLPQQEDITGGMLDPTNSYTQEFDVLGPKDGVYNGGLEVLLTCTNIGGTSPCAADEAVLERQNSAEPPVQGEDWEVVNTYFNQSPAYVQAGKALHGNLPTPGRYRIRIVGEASAGIYETSIDFTQEKGWEDPGQIGYRATNMKFWTMLKKYVRPGLGKVTPQQIRKTKSWKKKYETIVVTNKVYGKLAKKLRKWVAKYNGNLILTDQALGMLQKMKLIDAPASSEDMYAGYINFATATQESTYDHKLAKNINQPGAAEGQSGTELRRRQTYEPVPLGMAIQDETGADANNAPVWTVPAEAFDAAKGKPKQVGTSGDFTKVSLGQIRYRGGRIRFVGALLPMPTDAFDHPFGLADYALTYSGYQLLKNMMLWK